MKVKKMVSLSVIFVFAVAALIALGGKSVERVFAQEKIGAEPSPTPEFDQKAALARLRERIKGKEKEPSENVFRNIKDFKRLPAGRLLRIMEFGYSRSLGVDCTHCHVPGRWASEEKPTKQIARDMRAMAAKINRELLPSIEGLKDRQAIINCTTCHRGAVKPALNLPIPKTNYDSLKRKLQTKLDEWHTRAKFPGATIGIALANGDSFGLATGYSDRAKKTPMKADDFMLAGSVGKTYVAAVAMQLLEKGVFNLEDKIEKHLGDEDWFARLPNARDITIRNLMSHTSGLVRYEFGDQFIKDMLASPDKIWKPRELVAYLLDTKAPFEAGKGWEYSDTNYIVLGIIIEKTTGKKYYDLAIKNVLEPLKLRRTKPQISRDIEGLIPGYAGPDHQFGGEDEMIQNGRFVFNPQWEWTGGGMVTTSGDLARWAKSMYEGKAFSQDMLAEMLKGTDAPRLGKGAKYGLGVIIRPTPHGITYGHEGFFPGYMTDMMYFSEHKIAIAVQVNSSVPRDIRRRPSSVLVELMGIIKEETNSKAMAASQNR